MASSVSGSMTPSLGGPNSASWWARFWLKRLGSGRVAVMSQSSDQQALATFQEERTAIEVELAELTQQLSALRKDDSTHHD
jgi:hypothetical protein